MNIMNENANLTINPYFDSCDYANDFEALIDIHYIIPAIQEERFDLWLKAYDTSCCESEHEQELYDNNYLFECCCCVQEQDTGYIIKKATSRAARDEAEAEKILLEMAYEMINDENTISIINNNIDSCMTIMNF